MLDKHQGLITKQFAIMFLNLVQEVHKLKQNNTETNYTTKNIILNVLCRLLQKQGIPLFSLDLGGLSRTLTRSCTREKDYMAAFYCKILAAPLHISPG